MQLPGRKTSSICLSIHPDQCVLCIYLSVNVVSHPVFVVYIIMRTCVCVAVRVQFMLQDTQASTQTHKQTNKQTLTHTMTYTQASTQTHKQANKQTHTHTDNDIHTDNRHSHINNEWNQVDR